MAGPVHWQHLAAEGGQCQQPHAQPRPVTVGRTQLPCCYLHCSTPGQVHQAKVIFTTLLASKALCMREDLQQLYSLQDEEVNTALMLRQAQEDLHWLLEVVHRAPPPRCTYHSPHSSEQRKVMCHSHMRKLQEHNLLQQVGACSPLIYLTLV